MRVANQSHAQIRTALARRIAKRLCHHCARDRALTYLGRRAVHDVDGLARGCGAEQVWSVLARANSDRKL